MVTDPFNKVGVQIIFMRLEILVSNLQLDFPNGHPQVAQVAINKV
jgi:hypothetical protein